MAVLTSQARERRRSVKVLELAMDSIDAVGSALGEHSKTHEFDDASGGVDQLGKA